MKGETYQRLRLTESLFSILITDFFVGFSAVGRYGFSRGGILWDGQALVTFCLQCSWSSALRDRSHRKTSLGEGDGEEPARAGGSRADLGTPFHPKDNNLLEPVQGCA